jgi:hypothetical protein
VAASLAGIVLAAFVALAGADEELRTDRPDFTETAVVVGSGKAQLESGFTRASDDDAGRVLNAPELLVRCGFNPRAELRLAFDRQWRSGGGGTDEGSVGLKIQVTHETATLGLALLPAVTWPMSHTPMTGSSAAPPEATAELVVAWSRQIPSPWSVGGILGVSGSGDDHAYGGTLSVGRTLGERIGTFLEWAGEWDVQSSSLQSSSHLLHHGYTLALAGDSQLDLHMGLGLNEDAPDYFMGAGFAVRR